MYSAKIYIRGRARKFHTEVTAHNVFKTKSKTTMVLGVDPTSPLDVLIQVGTKLDNRGVVMPDFRWTNTRGIKVLKKGKVQING